MALIPENVDYISGPVSFDCVEWRGQRFYLFGDVHSVDSFCYMNVPGRGPVESVNVVDMLDAVFSNAREMIDFFIEIAFVPRDVRKPLLSTLDSPIMTEMMRRWQPSLRPSKKRAQFRNVRMHYSDVRKVFVSDRMWWKSDNVYSRLLRLVENAPPLLASAIIDSDETAKLFEKLCSRVFSGGSTKKTFDDMERAIFGDLVSGDNSSLARISKQWARLGTHSVSEAVRKYFCGQSMFQFRRLRRLMRTETGSDAGRDAVVAMESYVFDAYTIARMLRSGEEFEPRSRIKIVYAGSAHTYHMKQFMLSQGGVLLADAGDRDGEQCVYIGPIAYDSAPRRVLNDLARGRVQSSAFVVNVRTNRCIRSGGATAKMLRPSEKKAASGDEYAINSRTGRCVKKTGRYAVRLQRRNLMTRLY